MKTFVLLLFILPLSAFSFEWEAGIREFFLTPETYSFNSDSGARIRRELFDRGYNRLSLHPRIAYLGDDKSLFFLPAVKSPIKDIGVMNARVSQGDGEMTVKPIIFNNPGFGEARPLTNIRPKRLDIAFTSYGQVLQQYVQISRHDEVNRLIVGAGLVHLLADNSVVPRFVALLKSVRASLGPKTELLLEVTGVKDLAALTKATNPKEGNLDLSKLIDGVSLTLEPLVHFPNGEASAEEIKKTRILLDSILPGMPIHLSRVVVPSCKDFVVEGGEYYCTSGRDNKLQQLRFTTFKKALIALEKENILFRTVEILESTTDYEPSTPDPRYLYYNPFFSDKLNYELPIKNVAILPAFPMPEITGKNLACIFYDKNDLPPQVDRVGDIHSVMLESLLGAFKDWKIKRQRLKTFVQGDAFNCDAIFYLATNFSQELPEGFTEELAALSVRIPVVWFNYKFSQFNQKLSSINKDPGFEAAILIQPDSAPSPENQDPGFFRFFDYKGETFFKLAKWDQHSNNFSASPEIHSITIKNNNQVEVLSTARHSKNNQSIPYAVRSGNIWYIADSPFSFIHYEDRFYIFADLLWDILGETAPKERIALARIEDIGPAVEMADLRWAMDYLFDESVPFSLAVIPYYSDMIGTGLPDYAPVFKSISKYPDVLPQLKYAKKRGANIVMHGSLHSVGRLMSGYDGICGSDYEFWLYPENKPLPFDSVDWLTRRLELGLKTLPQEKLEPVAFEAPHYAASAMNYIVFGKMFQWNYHRAIYFPFSINVDTALPSHLKSDCKPEVCGDERRSVLANLRIEADYTSFGGMILPFITYRDAYGQSIIPETLGMIDFAFYDPNTWRPVSKPEDVIRRAKKLKVIRGAVASFFWHPQLLERRSRYYLEVPGSFEKFGGKKSLTLVIDGLKKLGYEFKSISDTSLFPKEII
ncbi:MAG: DUF2334 domain-containing protein [Bacteriovoracaceae bacterium]